MVNPRDLDQLDSVINTPKSVLIADNATVAKYNISDLEHIYTIGHGQVREAVGNHFDVTIQEPNGITLLSTIKTAATSLGINNHIQAGYIIVIEFNGRMPNGAAKKFPQVFYYPAIITDFTFKVNEGGSTYQIHFVAKNAAAYRYLTNHVPNQVTIVAQSVGEFFREFERLLNESELDAWIANPTASQYPTQYRFEFDPTTTRWQDWRFQVLDTPFTVAGVEFVGLPPNPSLQVSIPNGTQITTVFSYILQLTAEYKNIVMSQGDFSEKYARQSPDQLANQTDLDSFPVFMKVLSNIEYGPFDILSNEFSKTIVYKLKSYTVTDLVLESDLYKRGITNKRIQGDRITNMVSSGYLRKRYDYYFTGLNTEVLEFDMDFNFAFYQIMPNGGGYYGDPRVQMPKFINDKPEVAARLSELSRLVQDSAQATRAANQLRLGRQDSPLIVQAATSRARSLRDKLNDAITLEAAFLNEQYGLTSSEIAWGLRWAQDTISGQDMASSDNDEKSGTLKMGAVKVNLEESADFNVIEIGIRGDPYWMGLPDSFQQKTRNVDELADYEAGSVSFLLAINFPTTAEDQNGRRKPSPDFQLSGVFKVINVIGRFRNGQFTQHLKAARDMGTNLPTVWDKLSNDNLALRAKRQSEIRKNEKDIAQRLEDATRGIIRGF
jgi:hypothetical protein